MDQFDKKAREIAGWLRDSLAAYDLKGAPAEAIIDSVCTRHAAALREAAREAYEDAASYHDDQAKRCKSITDTTAPRQLFGYLAKRDQALHELAAADIRKRKP